MSHFQQWKILSVLGLFILMGRGVDGQQPKQPRLPGAQSEIDAAQFATIQLALDAVREEGGVVRLPPGRFEIDRPLVLRRGETRLVGAGAATHIVNVNQDGKPALVLQHSDGNDVKRDAHLWRIGLAHFRITGNPKSGHGIVANRIDEVSLHDITVTHHGGDGIRLDNCYEDPRINNCLITYNRQVGLNLIGCHDIVVAANQFEENQEALHCIDSFNLCMTGNCLDDHLGRGVLIENTYGSVLSGNMIEECQGVAVTLDRDCYGITISANVIAHNGGGIDLRDAHGCTVSANTLTIIKDAALRLGAESGRITVTGNNFSNSFVGAGQVKRKPDDQLAGGLVLEGTRDVTITGNVFAGLAPQGVRTEGKPSEGVIFAHNQVVDSENDLQQDDLP